MNTKTVEIRSDSGAKVPENSGNSKPLDLGAWRGSVKSYEKPSFQASSAPDEQNVRTCNGVQIIGEPIVFGTDNPLITSVTIGELRYPVSFYRNFKADVRRLWNKTASKCPRVSFFAYIPQHWQLDFHQLNWYVYWRSNALAGDFLETDYSYILLFIYEIINSPELVGPEKGLDLLAGLWIAFRGEYPKLDQLLGDWICDYCFINRLQCPHEKLKPVQEYAVRRAKIPEFYIDSHDRSECAAGLMTRLASYDWRKSGYSQSENAAEFDKHINAAFHRVYTEILTSGKTPEPTEKTRSYISYDTALCAPETRRYIEVRYLVFDPPRESGDLINGIIRYSENRVRAGLGISQRLKVNKLPDNIRECIDGYFDENFPTMAQKRRANSAKAAKKTAESRYDSLYEPIKSGFSLESALEIEKESWSTTEVLTSALGGGDEKTEAESAPDAVPAEALNPVLNAPSGSDGACRTVLEPGLPRTFGPSEASPPFEASGNPDGHESPDGIPTFAADGAEDPYAALIGSLDADCLEVVRLVSGGDHRGALKVASKVNAFADALVGKINEAAVGLTGDQIIEECDDGYRIIPDYMEDVEKCLK